MCADVAGAEEDIDELERELQALLTPPTGRR